jgi:hypothetical protein
MTEERKRAASVSEPFGLRPRFAGVNLLARRGSRRNRQVGDTVLQNQGDSNAAGVQRRIADLWAARKMPYPRRKTRSLTGVSVRGDNVKRGSLSVE